ncbi:MAG: ABC transporter permease [archaeon]
MNLINEIEKDAKQFMREKRTLILMLTAPLLVLFIMGAIFGGEATNTGKSTIGMCDLDNSNASQLFANGIKNQTQVIDYGTNENCGAELEKDVREGKLAAGLVINAGFEQGMLQGVTQNISVILDNSRFQVSPSIEAFVRAAVQETDQRIGTQFILSVWQQLNDANVKLDNMLVDIEDTRQRANDMKANLQETVNSLNALDIDAVRTDIYLANSTVQNTVVLLDNAESNLTKIESDFADYDNTLNQTEADLIGINDSLANASSYIQSAKAGVNCSDVLYFAYCTSLDSLNNSISSSQQSVELRIQKVRDARMDLLEANQTIQEFRINIASARTGATNAEQKINNMLDFVEQLEENRNSALQTINEVDMSLTEIISKTYELQNIISASRNQITQITSRPPEFVIAPMLVTSNQLFGNRPFFEFMLPSLLPLILMFIALFLASTSLVREKHGGTLTRVYTSQVNRFEFAAVKVLSYTVVLIPEAILLALIASVFYNAFAVSDLNAWFYVIQALTLLILTFVALGILIAIYSESEATAFLASLVVGLPMLFLSGLLFPFEFMPPLVAFFGMLSPLTQAVISMQAAILYNSPQAFGSVALIIYSVILTLLAALSLKK